MEGICGAFLAWYAPAGPTMTPILIVFCMLIAALATGDKLESSVHLLWLAQETSTGSWPCQDQSCLLHTGVVVRDSSSGVRDDKRPHMVPSNVSVPLRASSCDKALKVGYSVDRH